MFQISLLLQTSYNTPQERKSCKEEEEEIFHDPLFFHMHLTKTTLKKTQKVSKYDGNNYHLSHVQIFM